MSWIVNFAEKTTGFAYKFAKSVKREHRIYRSTQNELDTRKVFNLLKKYSEHKNQVFSHKSDYKYTFNQIKQIVAEEATSQVINLLENCKITGGYDPFPSPILPICSREGKTYEVLVEERMDLISEDELRKSKEHKLREKPIIHPENFQLYVKYSSIDHPESGFGIWVEGEAKAGTIIGFYPGTVYYPNQLTPKLVEGNEYLISRYDGIVIDGKHWSDQSIALRRKIKQLSGFHPIVSDRLSQQSNILDPDAFQEELLRYRNPFGIGNYINHPPANVSPNVLCFSYDFLFEVFDSVELSYLPYKYSDLKKYSFAYPDEARIAMRGLAVILTKDVHDEELFLNYRFNPQNPYPSWYSQPDLEEAQRRWGKIGIFRNAFLR